LEPVFSKVLDSAVLDVDRAALQLTVDGWSSQQTAALAVRSLRPCLRWAEKRALVQPGIWDLDPPTTTARRERFLAPDELRAIWPHLEGRHGQVVKWLLWTGCRLNEAAGMGWQEVHNSKWTIPAERAKNKRQRDVPLPSQAVTFLQALGPGEPGALVFPSTGSRVLSNWDRETKRLHERSGTSGWHRHDLRRTVATMLGDLSFAPHVVSVVLGHAHIAEGATAVYARSRYHREHREALQTLADEIDRITSGNDKVVRLAAIQNSPTDKYK
jgi:integrase